jgi:hypothetical protein
MRVFVFSRRRLFRTYIFILFWLYNSLLDIGRFFSFLILYTVGRTPWTGDQLIARPLHTHRTTQTKNTLSGIRTHDLSVRASEDSSCLSPRGHWDRRTYPCTMQHLTHYSRDTCKPTRRSWREVPVNCCLFVTKLASCQQNLAKLGNMNCQENSFSRSRVILKDR